MGFLKSIRISPPTAHAIWSSSPEDLSQYLFSANCPIWANLCTGILAPLYKLLKIQHSIISKDAEELTPAAAITSVVKVALKPPTL